MTAPHTGGCRCGAVRFEASVEPHHISYCHCGDCRRASGAPVSAFVGFMTDQIALDGKALKRFENGPVTRTFCGVCGSPIAYTDGRLAGHIYFTLGSMDMPAYFKPTHHAHVREQLPFLHMPDDLPRHLRTSVTRPDGQRPDGTQS
ncbi:GFA family protein [Mesorhizobium sp. M4B.F.Ca.ET.017.02.2.1]|uniref:GFA family protein n=1 Tax=Mesorhizobium sp. M4B.F.Ca.ET.017.02.2.1 TaxID=2496649 RepID=UPI000FC9F0BA|nr:GFA family protein [Mesorhizobium sp. M4B.F.Ca.ET.017.02.2.1]RVD17727.1 GFA family protein [Mesorhizobium sp. M4B.F.Ca.ET.017.02.2.1]